MRSPHFIQKFEGRFKISVSNSGSAYARPRREAIRPGGEVSYTVGLRTEVPASEAVAAFELLKYGQGNPENKCAFNYKLKPGAENFWPGKHYERNC
jgi:hypothetical protein